MDQLRFTILGCGSSGGVPRLGGNWGDCEAQLIHQAAFAKRRSKFASVCAAN